MGYTPFAKNVRKMMIDADENLLDLSELLDCSVSFVSLVFTGKKAVPESWVEIISKHYDLNDIQREELFEAYCESKRNVQIDLSNSNNSQRKLALQFQRNLNGLTEEEIERLSEILKKGGK